MPDLKTEFWTYPEALTESAWDVVSRQNDLDPEAFSVELIDELALWGELVEYCRAPN